MADRTVKNIEDILVGDRLMSKNGYVTVLELKPNRYDKHKVINKHLKITWEHPVLIAPNQLVEVQDLKIGDVMVRYDGTFEAIVSIENVNEETPTYNFIVDGSHLYVANDIVVHNPVRPVNKN